jgi:formylglycine-generating enzyme required for sulfatase activity
MTRLSYILLAALLFFSSCKEPNPSESGQNENTIEWIYVEGGTFQMGDTSGKGGTNERPVHTVTVYGFFIGKYEVTNAQFAQFLNAYKSDTVKNGENAGKKLIYDNKWGVQKTDGTWMPSPGYENHPVLSVPWEGANEFCRFYGYRLPTEAEWEYAARGGNRGMGYTFSGSDSIDEVAWYDYLENGGASTFPHPVGQKKENELGIFDMTGNVWEWCSDFYGPYSAEDQNDPTGPSSGKYHVYRGGCWLSFAIHCTVTYRVDGGSDYHGIYHNGFRCVHAPRIIFD